MNIYQIERTNKKTGESETELVEAESVSLAILKQTVKYGEDYTHRLTGHLTVSKLDNSYATPFTSPYRDDPDMAQYVDATSRLISNKQARLRKLLINRNPGKRGII